MKLYQYILIFIFISFSGFSQKQKTHKVVSGESFYSIAKKYDCSVDDLYDLNPKLKGKSLDINTIVNLPNSKNTIVTPKTHTVLTGESLFSISKKHNINLDELQKLNKDVNAKNLKKGMVLVLEKGSNKPKIIEKNILEEESNTNQYQDIFHIVKKGETLRSISKKYKTTIDAIRKLNPSLGDKLSLNTKLIVGKLIVFDTPKVKVIPQSNDSFIGLVNYDDHIEEVDDSGDVKHIVEKGETLYSISKKYNLKLDELKTLNPRVTQNLKVGRVLLIKKNSEIESSNTKVVYAELEEYVEDAEPLSSDELTKADQLINKSEEAIGVRYRSGGTTTSGFDCSGFMLFVFDAIDLKLPRTSSEQSRYGKKVKRKQAQKGDLIFFTTNGRGNINHVGMVTEAEDGEISFVHSSSSRGVIVSSLDESYWSKRFVKINRVLKK